MDTSNDGDALNNASAMLLHWFMELLLTSMSDLVRPLRFLLLYSSVSIYQHQLIPLFSPFLISSFLELYYAYQHSFFIGY